MSRPQLTSVQPNAYSRITAVGGFRGENAVTNDEIAGPINSSDEWIQQRTGIATRARANPETSVLDMAEAAALDAFARFNVDPLSIDALILATYSYIIQTPAGAPQVAERLGLGKIPAWDMNSGCAGYCYAIAQADALIKSGQASNVLIIGAEKQSELVDPADRSISFLLGDGAGAAVVSASETPGIGPTIWGADGAKSGLVTMTGDWIDTRDNGAEWPTVRQEGPAVFRWASFDMPKVAAAAIDAAGLTPDDIEVFIPHQANLRIVTQMVKQLHLPERVIVAQDIVETGNTSAASIPLATERLIREGQVSSGSIALQIGFGAGLAFASQVVVLP